MPHEPTGRDVRSPVGPHRRHPARRMVAEQTAEHLEVLGHIATSSASRRSAGSDSAATRPGSSEAFASATQAVDRLGGHARRRVAVLEVVAELERLAERAAEPGQALPHGRRSLRERGPDQERPLDGVAAAFQRGGAAERLAAVAPRRRATSRYCPTAIASRIAVVHGEGARRARPVRTPTRGAGRPRARRQVADEDRHRLAEAPGSPGAPSSSARSANHAAVVGTPRRSFAPSIRSSWTSAIVCRSSSAAAARTIGSSRPPSSPPAARNPQ